MVSSPKDPKSLHVTQNKIKVDIFAIEHPESHLRLTLVRLPSEEQAENDRLHWDLEMRPKIRHASDFDRTHQLWFFRNDCLVNLKMPWICLDPSSGLLTLAQFTGAENHQIMAKIIG